MPRTRVFTYTNGLRFAVLVADIERIQQQSDPNICRVVYLLFGETHTDSVIGTFADLTSRLEETNK
jgi:hypothetical protein